MEPLTQIDIITLGHAEKAVQGFLAVVVQLIFVQVAGDETGVNVVPVDTVQDVGKVFFARIQIVIHPT